MTAIREADTDGNPLTQPDLDWTPLSFFTPNFPGYTSGHSTFGGSNSQLMRRFFGFDEITFDLQTEDPHLDAGWTRTIHSFTQAEEENRDSRIWLGVHFRFDCEQGVELGHHIADWAYDNYLRPIEPLTSSVIGRRNPVQLLTIAPNPTQGRRSSALPSRLRGRSGSGSTMPRDARSASFRRAPPSARTGSSGTVRPPITGRFRRASTSCAAL
ncbi:MAG: vanadium-dependent haloperoxidase [Candidatus Eisenbacteria bacterium]|nr:vanadium-dependent haloperoxidase [Candidatus Eisenbacteria bacterium]